MRQRLQHKLGVRLFCIVYLLCPVFIEAKNLGVIGTVYPIAETDFLEGIQWRMQEKIRRGELTQWQAMQMEAIKVRMDRPTPVTGLTPARQNRSWLYDPTLTLQHDLLDAQGQTKLPAGTHLNPLEHVTWRKTLLFYDGDNAAQVAWAMQMDQQLKGQVTCILVQGSVMEQEKTRQKRVYFDQGGQLVQRFGITHVPASVQQEGKQLRVTEVKL